MHINQLNSKNSMKTRNCIIVNIQYIFWAVSLVHLNESIFKDQLVFLSFRTLSCSASGEAKNMWAIPCCCGDCNRVYNWFTKGITSPDNFVCLSNLCERYNIMLWVYKKLYVITNVCTLHYTLVGILAYGIRLCFHRKLYYHCYLADKGNDLGLLFNDLICSLRVS